MMTDKDNILTIASNILRECLPTSIMGFTVYNRDDILKAMLVFGAYRADKMQEEMEKERDKWKDACYGWQETALSWINRADLLDDELRIARERITELEKYIHPDVNVWGAKTEDTHKFFMDITKNAGQRDE